MDELPTREDAPPAMPAGSGVASLVLIYGEEIGRRWSLADAGLSIGRAEECDVVVGSDSVSRRHARVYSPPGGGFVVEDCGSRNGTLCNGALLTDRRALRAGDLVAVGRCVFKFVSGESVEDLFHQEIYDLASLDSLTRVYSKRMLLDGLARELSRCDRHHRPCALLFVDVDRFKEINDEHGHLAGDHALREVAGTLRVLVRREVIVGRYGGDEFALVVPEVERAGAAQLAERLRAAVQARDVLYHGTRLPLTVSIGGALSPPSALQADALIAAADEQLFKAKRAGRNQVAL